MRLLIKLEPLKDCVYDAAYYPKMQDLFIPCLKTQTTQACTTAEAINFSLFPTFLL